jgi:hypothetical protein
MLIEIACRRVFFWNLSHKKELVLVQFCFPIGVMARTQSICIYAGQWGRSVPEKLHFATFLLRFPRGNKMAWSKFISTEQQYRGERLRLCSRKMTL